MSKFTRAVTLVAAEHCNTVPTDVGERSAARYRTRWLPSRRHASDRAFLKASLVADCVFLCRP